MFVNGHLRMSPARILVIHVNQKGPAALNQALCLPASLFPQSIKCFSIGSSPKWHSSSNKGFGLGQQMWINPHRPDLSEKLPNFPISMTFHI